MYDKGEGKKRSIMDEWDSAVELQCKSLGKRPGQCDTKRQRVLVQGRVSGTVSVYSYGEERSFPSRSGPNDNYRHIPRVVFRPRVEYVVSTPREG